eukprot:gene14384-19301_t
MLLNLTVVLISYLLTFAVSDSEMTIKVDSSSHSFVDSYGRLRIFHGVNAVYKMAPWHPTVAGFDSENTLSDIDAVQLKKWGFNIVRLGVMWPGVEPGKQGDYNQTYLDQIEILVTNLGKEDIQVILDFHQDLWHRKFCGEGVPDYIYELCVAAESSNTPSFPLPAVNATYPLDANGDPTLESCLSVMFATYYLSAEVGAGFQCLYDNVNGVWDAMAGYWMAIANRFKSTSNVIGYELINEPWAGDVYKHPQNLLPQVVEKKYLQPLYEHLHSKIRSIDNEKIIFFEGLTIDYWPNGFSQGPGGPDYNDRQALAYHIYCPLSSPSVKGEVACDAIDDEFFYMRRGDADRIGGGMIMTEFGAAEDIKGDMYALENTAKLMDKFMQSWMYWQYKYYQDITTCTPQGESLFEADGSVCEDKIKVLSRTYPQAVAGKIVNYSFDRVSSLFHMDYYATTSTGPSSTSQTSEIYFNRDLYYPHGVRVTVNVEDGQTNAIDVVCPSIKDSTKGSNIIHLVNSNNVNSSLLISVELAKCGLADKSDSCTCK